MGTQLGRRKNPDEQEAAWAEEEAHQAKKLPPNHGQIQRDEQRAVAVATVKPPGSHVDAEGREIVPYQRINEAAQNEPIHGKGSTLEQKPIPGHQVGGPPPQKGAREPAGHGDPRLAPQSEPQTAVYRIQASTTSPSGAQRVDTQHGAQTMAERAHQGGVHRVGGQPVQPSRGVGLPASVHAVPGEVSPQQAAQFIAQAQNAPNPPAAQFQGGAGRAGASVGVGAHAPGAAPGTQVIPQSTRGAGLTITKADEETTRRELEAAGMEDRLQPKIAPTTIGRRAAEEDLGPRPRLDVTVVLSAFGRPQMLARQVDALRRGSAIPQNVVVLTAPNIGGVAEVIADGTPWVQGGPLPHNIYGVAISPWERFRVAARVPTQYVCVLDDDCIPGEQWLGRAIELLERGLPAVIAAAGARVTDDGARVAYFGPKRHVRQTPEGTEETIHAPKDEQPGLAPLVDIGEGGWVFRTEWMPAIAQISFVGEPPYGWQIHAAAMLQGEGEEDTIPTVVLPYGEDPALWGMTIPPLTDGLRNVPDMDRIRAQVFSAYREEGWMLCAELGDEDLAMAIDAEGEAAAEEIARATMPPGTYFNKKLDRYVEPGDPEWSAEHYELLTGETWTPPAKAGEGDGGEEGGGDGDGDGDGDTEKRNAFANPFVPGGSGPAKGQDAEGTEGAEDTPGTEGTEASQIDTAPSAQTGPQKPTPKAGRRAGRRGSRRGR